MTFKRSALAIGVTLALAAAAPVFAQSTSAGVSGRVVDTSGNPVAGATVEIVHLPSGSRRTVTTDAQGRYDARGLRVGGPYRIVSNATGKEPTIEEDVFLRLDEQTSIPLTLADEAAQLEAIDVVASAATTVFSPDNMGARTNVTREDIESYPSIGRALQDYVRFDPRIVQTDKERGQISAAGQNNRYNNIRIDGVPTNDQFGLNDSGLPSLNQPISIDWIEEFNIGISNFDVTQGDFTGANINAVTKSGGNEFSGGVYYLYRDNDMIGDEPAKFRGFSDEWTAGVYVGGPIIQDTLFFFVGYEEFERADIAPDVGLAGSGRSTIVQGITQADIDQLRQVAQSQYGLDIGNFSLDNVNNTDEKWFAKLDWNINDQQRLTYRYNNTEGAVLRTGTLNPTTLRLASNFYTDNIGFENHALILYSNWNDVLSTESSVSYSEYRSEPTFPTRSPQVRVGFNNNATAVFFGTERSRHANELAVDTLTANLTGDLFLGDHTVRFGADYVENDIFNLFLQDVFGNYNFTSLANFQAGNWQSLAIQRSVAPDIASAAAQFKFGNLGLFLQDTWSITPQLTLMYGLRADIIDVNNEPAYNAAAQAAFGLDNRTTADGQVTVQPRVGFNYAFETERLTQLRGGIGLFQGSAPGVWLSNQFSNTGVLARGVNLQNGRGFSADPNQPFPAGTQPASNVDFLSEDFQQPTVWRANLAFEHELPWYGLIASVEYLSTIVDTGIQFENLNLGAPRGTLPDGRNFYYTNVLPTSFTATGTTGIQNRAGRNLAFNNVILTSNSGKGKASNITLGLEKPFADNWGARINYTYGESKDNSPGTSSVSFSNWLNRAVYNPNEDVEATSNYENRHRFVGNLTYRFNFIEGYPTTFGLFYEGRSGRPFSYTFRGDANGDGITGNDLFFIPGPGQVLYTANSSANDRAAFERYVQEVAELRDNQGSVAERNAARAPWANQFDLRISQELPGFFGDNRAEVFVDIQNIGNLINKDWGQIDEVAFPLVREVARMAGVDPTTGRYVYDVSTFVNETTGAETFPALLRRDVVGESRWAVQVGFRYEF